MTMKNLLIAGLIVLIGGGGLLWLWPNEARAIRTRLAVIEKAGTKKEGENVLEGQLRAHKIAELFQDPCELQVETVQFKGTYGRHQIQDRIAMIRSSFTRADVTLYDVSIDILAEKRATVQGTLRLLGTRTGEPMADVQEFRAEMLKDEGQWFFTTVALVEVLHR
ncbi:MAG: hypothetical protein GXY53_09025 [Desulfobulbus sp.]|nr:hypothetical protein [Desulfobulbus sp.]